MILINSNSEYLKFIVNILSSFLSGNSTDTMKLQILLVILCRINLHHLNPKELTNGTRFLKRYHLYVNLFKIKHFHKKVF